MPDRSDFEFARTPEIQDMLQQEAANDVVVLLAAEAAFSMHTPPEERAARKAAYLDTLIQGEYITLRDPDVLTALHGIDRACQSRLQSGGRI